MIRNAGPASPSGQTPDAALAMLRGGAVPATVVIAAVTLVSACWGASEALGAIVGGLVVVAAMSVGPVLLRTARDWSPPAVMAVAVIGYGGAVIVLGVAFLILSSLSWLSPGPLGAALVAGTVGWIVGQVRAVARLRILAFGDASGRPGAGPA